jgi:hypothetical protein
MNVTIDLQDAFDVWASVNSEEKSAPLVKLPNDPVACACASYRTWKENPARRWEDLETVVVWQDDIEEAERLKKYYRDRLVIQALKNTSGTATSSFRQKLGKLVVNELEITKKEIGLLCRLPYFYQEDQDLDFIVANTNCNLPETGPIPVQNYTIVPIKQMLRSRSTGDYYVYWFRDTIYNTAHNLVVKHDNPLRSLVDGLFALPQIRINATLFRKQFRGYHQSKQCYQLASVTLVG